MPRALHLTLATLLLGASGCYLWHSRADDSEPTPATDSGSPLSRRDAGRDPPPDPRDASSPLPRAVDGGAPLPDDEPDVEPDERPSDDPGADEWHDPPSPDGEDPCCDVLGERVGLDDPDRQAGPPSVAWNGSEFGVAWNDAFEALTFFRRVAADGTTPAPAVEHRGFGPISRLAWGNHRYALLAGAGGWRDDIPHGVLGILDESGALRVGAVAVPHAQIGGSIARYPIAHGWAVATAADPEGLDVPVRLFLYDDDLARLEVERDLGSLISMPVLVAVKSRFVVIGVTAEGIHQHTFAGRELDEDFPPSAIGDPGTFVTERGLDQVAWAVHADRFRDTVVIASLNGTALSTMVFDPFTGTVVSPLAPIAPTPEFYVEPGVAGSDVDGTIGVCFADGEGPFGGYTEVTGSGRGEVRRGPPDADTVRFALLGPDGRRLGATVAVVDDLRYHAACAVAAHGDEYLVAWWNAARDAPRHSIEVRRVRVRR